MVLPVSDSALNWRAIGVHVENRQENPHPAHPGFQNFALFDFGNVRHSPVRSGENRVPIRRNISIRISKKEKRVENQDEKKKSQESSELRQGFEGAWGAHIFGA